MAKPFVVIATWNKWMVAVGISNIAERKGRPNLSGSSRQVRSQNGLNFGLLLVGLPRGRSNVFSRSGDPRTQRPLLLHVATETESGQFAHKDGTPY
jgi:hypothetical protein